jgi:hypothetical protein
MRIVRPVVRAVRLLVHRGELVAGSAAQRGIEGEMMIGSRTLPWSVSRWMSRAALAGGLLLGGAAFGDEQPGQVQFSSGFEACPSDQCPPGMPGPGISPPPGLPPYGHPSYGQPWYGPPSYGQPSYGDPRMAPRPGQQPSTGQPSTGQPSTGQPSLPQADSTSPVPAPFTAGTQQTQAGMAGPGLAPGGLAAATAPAAASPNMIGDFFGAINSQPLILPGALVTQAILMEPTPMMGGPALLDYYRAVDPLGANTYQTNQFVYLGTRSGGLPTSVTPGTVPPQLLQQYDDGGVFTGDPADLNGDPVLMIPGGFLTDPGPFIALDSGETGDVGVLSPEMPEVRVGELLYNIHDALLVFAPTPGSGGGVGRQKIAENTSPLPRDRVFINHSTFTGVPFTNRGVSVYRFAPGIEKSFYEQQASLEVRLPFASTIDSDINASTGPETNSTQFGNIVTTLKALVRQTSTSAVAVGVSLTAPTANDLSVGVNGTPFLVIKNESLHAMPYIGGTNFHGRWFSQWYLQGDIDTTGSPVYIRDVTTGQIERAGVLHDAPMLYASLSGGYWIYQKGHRAVSFVSTPGKTVKQAVYTGGGGITGLAPIMEVHFNRSLDKSEVIRSGPIEFRSASDFSLTNLVLGAVMTFGTGGSVTAAWGTPIIGQDDKQYEHEVRVMLEYEY